ncbi:MAG: porin family protein [Thermoanaerobaculia bacterium]|nr:porin family protein [Thermoanaerobaculia bacterium]
MRQILCGLTIVLLAATAAPAAALDSERWYWAVGPSLVFESFSLLESVPAPLEIDDSALGASLRVGRKVGRRVATEVALQYVPRFDFAIGVVAGDVGGYALTGNVKGYLNDARLRGYGYFGLGVLYLDASSNATFNRSDLDGVGCVGIGLELEASETIDVFLDLGYYRPFSDLSDYELLPLSAGVKVRF